VADADYRALVCDLDGRIVGHVSPFIHNAQWNACAIKIGGIGAVAGREDSRRKEIASTCDAARGG
jgi:hypothetical protein